MILNKRIFFLISSREREIVKKSLPLSKVYQLIEPGPVVMVSTSHKGKDNVMTMTWLSMVEFEPPLIMCVMSDENYSFNALKTTKECVINIPSAELVPQVVGVGNCSGKNIDKFKKFSLMKKRASKVAAPLIEECYANLECKVVNTSLVSTYNIFILQVIKAWIRPTQERPLQLHHCGKGVFVIDGDIVKLPTKKK